MWTSPSGARTRCTVLPASVSCMVSATCSKPCRRPTSAAPWSSSLHGPRGPIHGPSGPLRGRHPAGRQVVAAGVAAEWMMNIGLENIEAHEKTIAAELLKLGDVDAFASSGRAKTWTASAPWRSTWPACIRTMWASSSTPRASRFAWDTTAPSRYTATSAYTHPTVPPPVSTIRSKMPKRRSKRPRHP